MKNNNREKIRVSEYYFEFSKILSADKEFLLKTLQWSACAAYAYDATTVLEKTSPSE